jgi:hypothetical protein
MLILQLLPQGVLTNDLKDTSCYRDSPTYQIGVLFEPTIAKNVLHFPTTWNNSFIFLHLSLHKNPEGQFSNLCILLS